jgi:hypothetical protein
VCAIAGVETDEVVHPVPAWAVLRDQVGVLDRAQLPADPVGEPAEQAGDGGPGAGG